MKTKKYAYSILGIILCFLLYNKVNAQVYYFYDNNGNRITSSTHHAPEKRQDSNKVKVYPNPTNGEITVSISPMPTCGFATIYIIDGSGNIVSTQKTSTQMTTVNLTTYNPGMYYMRVITCDNNQYTCKIVKVNPNSSATPPQPTQRTPVKY